MKAPALVVDVGWVNGLAAIRSLGRAGVPVIAVDHRPSALGFRSRYARPVLSPDPQDEDAFIAFLAGLELDAPAPVFATHDEPLNAIARGAEKLGGRFLYPFPPWEVLARIQTKRGQLEAAEAAGIPIPRTAYPASAAEARAAADELGYPVLVKPSSTEGFKRRFGRQAFRCDTAEEVARAFTDSEPYEPLVQEVIPGGDEELYSLGSYLAADGEALGLFSGPEAAPDSARRGHLPRRRGGLGRGGRAAGADAAAGARLPRALAGRVQARPAGRQLQADGDQPAFVAVARARLGVRGRPPADRVRGSHRRAARARLDEREAPALGDHAPAR